MNNIKVVCPENGAYKHRPETDVLFKIPDGSFRYSGLIDSTIKYIQNIQLLRSDLWRAFVNQFRNAPDSETLSWKGEYWGKMMRGASFTYQYTQDEELYKVMCETVRDLLTTQDSLGRISSYSVDKEFDGWDLWSRKYVLLGLQYFMDVCRDEAFKEEIINAMCRHTDYIMQHVGNPDEGKREITACSRAWMGLNSSSILEPVVRLYNLTGEQKYFDFATHIVGCGGITEGNIFELALEDKLYPYEYPTTKAYEMTSCFEGLLEYYRVTKIEKYKTAVVNFAKKVLESDITIIGCSGCTHELFDFSAKRQTTTDYFDIMQETCVTVTWMKFCHQVLGITGDSSFADAIEISTYNAMLGSVNSNNRKMLNGFAFDSYAPLFMNVRSKKSGGYQAIDGNIPSYGCCACIGAAGTALMGLSSVMQSKDGIYLNLYIPGTVNVKTPEGTDIVLKIDTLYPVDGKINIFVQKATGEEEFTLAFRIPSWCEKADMTVCGEKTDVTCGTYKTVSRKWKCCDKIVLDFDMPMKAVLPPFGGADENGKTLVALTRGPLTFARDARLGDAIDGIVDIDYDENMVVKCEKADAPFECLCAFDVFNKDGSTFRVCDFQSAGKTWDEESVMTVWMPTKKFWDVDFTKPVQMNSAVSFFSVLDGVLTPTRGDRVNETFTFEDAGDGAYYIKSSDGRYVTAEKFDGGPDAKYSTNIENGWSERYYLVLREKGGIGQKWRFERSVINRYRMISCDFGGAVTHAHAYHDIFILCDTTKNDLMAGYSYVNNGYVDIVNV